MSNKNSRDRIIKEHYKQESRSLDSFNQSTMKDEVVLTKEVEFILNFIDALPLESKGKNAKVLDLGCGNGYTLNIVARSHPQIDVFGLDLVDELISISKIIMLENCKVIQGDARKLCFQDNYFDVIYTQRCLINILDLEEQKLALREIHRTLKADGYYLMIECFSDGLTNYNAARKECGLDEIKEAYHNKYFEKDLFMKAIEGLFSIVDPKDIDPNKGDCMFPSNFLSSHYFISRVLHALVTKDVPFIRNSEFVKFFSFLPPQGNYSPIQAYILRKAEVNE
jgi:ubiquinone/menaquinone biosynthesis C-methylase UbiE